MGVVPRVLVGRRGRWRAAKHGTNTCSGKE